MTSGDIPAPHEDPSSARFTGDAKLQEVHAFARAPVRVSLVTFPPGVSTHWHRHTGGQLLVVLAGTARVQDRGGNVDVVGPGESCLARPDVEHWHGAAGDGPMTHIAISGLQTLWGEAPHASDED